MAALDDEIGIGANHRHIARLEIQKHVGIILRLLGFVVEEAGADERLRFAGRAALDADAFEKRLVALGAEQKHGLRSLGDQPAGDIARGNDPVIGAVGNADMAQLLDHLPGKARRIGDEHDRHTALARRFKGRCGLRKRIDAVVNHAPDITEHHIIAIRDLGEVFYPPGHSNFPICFSHR